MFSAILSTWALLAGVALLMLGNGLQGTLLGVRASQESFDTLATGIIMTCYFAGFLLGSLFTPKVIRRVGHIRVFAAYASVASAAVLLHSIWVTPLVWALVRLLTGVCFAGLYVISESWLNDRATNETRGALLSAYMLVTLGSMICGQLLINAGDTQGFDLFIFASVLVSLAVVPIAPHRHASASVPRSIIRQHSSDVPNLTARRGRDRSTGCRERRATFARCRLRATDRNDHRTNSSICLRTAYRRFSDAMADRTHVGPTGSP